MARFSKLIIELDVVALAAPRQLNRYTLQFSRDMTSEIILQAPVDCLAPTGERFTVSVELGRPYKTKDGPWACPTRIPGLYDNLVDIRGEDSLQALCLAASLVRALLAGVIESGGRLLHPNTDDSYELDATFGSVGKPPDQRL